MKKVIICSDYLSRWANSAMVEVDCFSDEDWCNSYYDIACDTDFFEVEEDVERELGLYLDFSTVRGTGGEVFIFSDPDHLNNYDMWMGDPGAEIDRLEFSDYASYVAGNIFSEDKSKWRDLYRDYLISLAVRRLNETIDKLFNARG